jgi:hypothetical protein
VGIYWRFHEVSSQMRAILLRTALNAFKINWRGFTSLEFGVGRKEVDFKILADYSEQSQVNVFNPVFKKEQGHVFNSRFLFEISDVLVDTKTGMVFTQNGKIIEETTSTNINYTLLNSVPHPPKFFNKKLSDNTCNYYVLTSTGFYHFLIEDLPRAIFARDKLKRAKALVYFDAPNYVLEFARILNITYEIMPRFVSVNAVSVVGFTNDTAWPHPKDLEQLRIADIWPESTSKTKLYVSRASSTRSPKYELELIDLLGSDGWTCLELEKISIKDQIALFKGAAVIAGVHGAGLSNMVWASSSTQIIELSPNEFNPIFSRMASILSIKYDLIMAENLKADEIILLLEALINLSNRSEDDRI